MIGIARMVNDPFPKAGTFRWTRSSAAQTKVYFTWGTVRSNTVTIASNSG